MPTLAGRPDASQAAGLLAEACRPVGGLDLAAPCGDFTPISWWVQYTNAAGELIRERIEPILNVATWSIDFEIPPGVASRMAGSLSFWRLGATDPFGPAGGPNG